MKSYDEKREVLFSLAELYLNTKEDSYIDIDDGIANSSDFDSISFLMLLALTSNSERDKNVYSIDFDINIEIQNNFIDKEYKKIIKSKYNKLEQGKVILDDARSLYNSLNNSKIEEVAENIEKIGIHI